VTASGYCPRKNSLSRSIVSSVHVGRPWLHWPARSVSSIWRKQGVHFRHGELAAGADGAVAGHGGEEFVAPGGGELGDAVFAQFGDQRFGQGGGVARLEQGRDAAHAELVGAERGDLEAEVGKASVCSSTAAMSSGSAEKTAGISSACVAIWRLSKAVFSFS
jgi:hypothetical protein